jgi:hypothetical protein
MVEKERKVLRDTELYRCESVEISGKRLYMYFHVSYIRDTDRLEEYVRMIDGAVSGTVPLLVARLKAGEKLVEYYRIGIVDVYGGDLYIKRITEDRPFKKYGILYINYHGRAEYNYVMPYKEKDELGEADEFDYLVYGEMMLDMVRYVEEGAEVLFLSERRYDPVDYKRVVLRAE